MPANAPSLSRRHRFPGEIIAHAVWLDDRFHLSCRDVEDLLAQRGIEVSSETIRRGWAKFGPTFAHQLRRRRARPGDNWQLEEVAIRLRGCRQWLWRAVDQNGVVLDIAVPSRRDHHAAERFLRQLVDRNGYPPRIVITDELASYPPAIRRVVPNVDHRRHTGLNNRADNSHLPVRKRERVLQRFNQPSRLSRCCRSSAPSGTTSVRVATA